MPKPYPAEFRARAVALVRAGRPISRVAVELGVSEGGLHNWVRQDRIDRGEIAGVTTSENAELQRARRRIRELELQVEILTKASAGILGRGATAPKMVHPVIDRLVDAGLPAKVCCRVLGVSSPGYYKYRTRPMSPTRMRRQWLTGLTREVHLASRGTYGSRRVHAELTIGMDVQVSERLVAVLMSGAGIYGLTGPTRIKRVRGLVTADDLVNRKFARQRPNELWVTDITEHPTREGKVYCCCVMDTFSRKIVGWSIDSMQTSSLVVNALDMAIKNRQPAARSRRHRARRPRRSVHLVVLRREDPLRRADAVIRNSRGRPGQRHDRIVLVLDADRAAQPTQVAHPSRVGQRHVRLHRNLP